MSILRPGFSERVFEFAFNAEYAQRKWAVLAGAPHIPTQNEEKWLGYDVAFEIMKGGGAIHLLALQHKVSRFVDSSTGTNKKFWDAVGGPYFAFRLDSSQYNDIQAIAAAGLPGIEFYYCAPLFADRKAMDANYLAQSVETNAIWLDVSGAGQITDGALHTISYAQDGSKACRLSSSPLPIPVLNERAREIRWKKRRNAKLDLPSVVTTVYQTAFRIVEEQWPRTGRAIPSESGEHFTRPTKRPEQGEPTLERLGLLLGQYFGISLLVEIRKRPREAA